MRPAPAHRRYVLAASTSTSPRTAPCCTSRCARRGRRRSWSTATTSCPRCTRCSTGWPPSPTVARRRLAGPHRQAHPQRGQHRHRRLRPRPGDGLRGAAPLQRARDDVPLRLQRRRHRLRRGHARPRPGRDAVHRRLQDLHHARDHDQRPHRARLVARRAGRRRGGVPNTSSRCRPTPRRCPPSASTPTTCSASGTGSAGATRWTRRSACRPCSRSGRSGFRDMLAGFHAIDEHFRTAPFERNLPVLMGLLGVWYAASSAPRPSPCCPTTSTSSAFRPICSS